MSTKEAKNDVAVDKIADDVVDAKADLKGTKRTADVSSPDSWFFFDLYCVCYLIIYYLGEYLGL
jgi:hypothetical protein